MRAPDQLKEQARGVKEAHEKEIAFLSGELGTGSGDSDLRGKVNRFPRTRWVQLADEGHERLFAFEMGGALSFTRVI